MVQRFVLVRQLAIENPLKYDDHPLNGFWKLFNFWSFFEKKGQYCCFENYNYTFVYIFSMVSAAISLIIFGYELHEKCCMDRLPWKLIELIFPVFMVLLLATASIVGLITASVAFPDTYYQRLCIAAACIGLTSTVPFGVQAFFQYAINKN